jgi:hypothetical protein
MDFASTIGITCNNYSLKFHHFLQSECVAIQSFVDEVGQYGVSGEEEMGNMKMIDQINRYPELQDYYDLDLETADLEVGRGDEGANISISQFQLWPRSVRVSVIDYIIGFDINLSLLINVVESYRFEAEMDELIEIVRSMDILGAEMRLSEYEAILFLKLKDAIRDVNEWKRIYGERLPVNFFDHIKKFQLDIVQSYLQIIGIVGSQRLIEYFLENDKQWKHRYDREYSSLG